MTNVVDVSMSIVKKTLHFSAHTEHYFVVIDNCSNTAHSEHCSGFYADIDQLAQAAALVAFSLSAAGKRVRFLFPFEFFLIEKNPEEVLFLTFSSLSISEHELFLEKFDQYFFDSNGK